MRNKLNSLKIANGDVGAAETLLKEGHIEESLDIAADELKLAANHGGMESVSRLILRSSQHLHASSWEPLVEKPEPGQWEYPGQTTTA